MTPTTQPSRGFLKSSPHIWGRLGGVVLITLLTAMHAPAQNRPVTIEGRAPGYSGQTLIFKTHQNFINDHTQELFSLTVDESGHFKTTSYLNDTLQAFVDLSVYRAQIYLQPGESYQLVLPPFRQVNREEEFSPFFRREKITIGIANSEAGDLNRRIHDFEAVFDNLFNDHARQLYAGSDRTLAQNLIDSLEAQFPGGERWFRLHKRYRYARLWRLAARRDPRGIIHRYFAHEPVCFSMPAYREAFHELIPGYLENYLTPGSNEALLGALTEPGSFRDLSQTLATDSIFARADFREMALLAWMYRRFYKHRETRSSTLKLMQQAGQTAALPRVRETANVLFGRMSLLQPGSTAPGFTLYNRKGEEVSLADFRGKFVYLNFMHTQNYACRKALNNLSTLSDRFKNELTVVTILLNQEERLSESYIQSLNPTWPVLMVHNHSHVLDKYDVKAVPAWFLINPDGEIALSPAPAPLENFNQAFAEQFLKYRRKKQREEPQKEGSIFDL